MVYGFDSYIDNTLSLAMTLMRIIPHYSECDNPEGGMWALEELFCHIDDFCQVFEPQWQAALLGNGLKRRCRARSLNLSEIMTILVSFHKPSYRNFKHFYQKHVYGDWKRESLRLPSYQSFTVADDYGCQASLVLMSLQVQVEQV